MNPLDSYKQMLRHVQPLGIRGRVSAVRGLTVGVTGFAAPIGATCSIVRGKSNILGRVIGFADEQTLVMPLGSMAGICRGDRVILTSEEQTLPVGPAMLGRVINGMGQPIDGRGDLPAKTLVPLWPEPIGAMQRRRITEPLSTGVRAIDAMLTIGRGQRMGIFSGSGVGKSVLLGMIGRSSSADVTVIALIGERGREVRDFIERDLGEEGLRRAVVVVSTGDEPPMARVQAGAVAAAVAEYFRDNGSHVLLLMDSLTRLAGAQRQIGLLAGEPPATKGYTPSVFNLLPQLLERSGRTETGSITGFYTVLVEGDDPSEPISDAVRAVTDGHMYLSRALSQRGHYPAIDVLQSVSRVMTDVADESHCRFAREIQRLVSLYNEVEDVLNIGAYQAGSNPEFDRAIQAMPLIRQFLIQGVHERCSFEQMRMQMDEMLKRIESQRQPLPGIGRTPAGAR